MERLKLIRDLNNRKILIAKEDKTILELGFVADEFAIIFYDNTTIPITKELDKTLFEGFNRVLNNSYFFSQQCGKQDKNSIEWLSDGTCDLEDEESRNKVNHFTIRRNNNTIYLSITNPFEKSLGLNRTYHLVAFSPAGNGFFASNRETGSFFQDDITRVFLQTLCQKVAHK